jgi:hypothetical protein
MANRASCDAFDAVPEGSDGLPMLVATTEEDYWLYLRWLADYLYRPEDFPGESLRETEALSEVIGLEIDIASSIWNDPYADYPPASRNARTHVGHADFLHRKELSEILSRVPSYELTSASSLW